MNTPSERISILHLPAEIIVKLCMSDAIKPNDIFNISVSHSKFNQCLFGEPNSRLWKTKWEQKYGQRDNDEFAMTIDEQNFNWKDELKNCLTLDNALFEEIIQISYAIDCYRSMSVPHHLYPFSEELHSNNSMRRHYILSAAMSCYKRMLGHGIERPQAPQDQLNHAHHFLVYSSHVYFGNKIKNFLHSPNTEHTIERGFYFLSRWWCPTYDTQYRTINELLNNMAMNVYNLIRSTNPTHPLFDQEDGWNKLVQRGKTNINHDLFNESDSMVIFNTLRQILFRNNQYVCYCLSNINCFLLQKVLERNKGSVLIVNVIFESIARRLGVKVEVTPHNNFNNIFITWSPSWPGNTRRSPTYELFNIPRRGDFIQEVQATRESRENIGRNSMSGLFWMFGLVSQSFIKWRIDDSITMFKYGTDFQNLIEPTTVRLNHNE